MSFVSANLAYVRRQLGLSQAQMAEQLSIKRSLLGAYEEARATPRYDVLEKLSELSGHSVSDLLNRRLVPEGYQAPSRRGRLPGSKNRPAEPSPAALPQQAPIPALQVATVQGPATLTLTLDTTGQPLATLVTQAEQSRYGSQSHQASYIAALPTLSIPMLDRQQAYRGFEVEPGFIHIGRLVRNWAAIGSSDSLFLLVYTKQVLPAHAIAGAKGISWSFASGQRPPAGEEPLEIWESEWVLTRRWEPLPQQLEHITERLTAIEDLLGR